MKRRVYSKVLAAVFNTVWAIRSEKLQQIMGLLDLRSRGVALTRAEIRAQVGEVEQPPLREDLVLAPRGGAPSAQGPKIAVLNVYGTIAPRMNMMMEASGGTSAELLGKAFDQVLADPQVGAILLNVDSPGGAVPGIPELAAKIFAGRGRKPIVALANYQMASAAYWIATAADTVLATPSAAAIGSIGVVRLHRDETKALEKAGIGYTIFRSAAHKFEGSPFEPLSDAYRQHAQAEVAKLHSQFVETIARHRNVAVSRVDSEFGQGRDYKADDALARGMIDRIATYDAIVAELAATLSAEPQSQTTLTRVQTATSPALTTAAQPQPTKESTMDPKLKLALVQLGLVRVTADKAECDAAVALYYLAVGKTAPTDAAELLKEFEAAVAQTKGQAATLPAGAPPNGTPAPTKPTNAVGILDVMPLVQTAGASLDAEGKMGLVQELTTLAHAGTLTLPEALKKINDKAAGDNPPAGHRPPVSVTADARDKFVARARDAILCAAWGTDLPKEILNFQTDAMVEWKPAGADREYGLQSPIKIATQCLIQCGYPVNQVLGLAKSQIARLVMGARPQDIGLGGLGGPFASSDGPAYNVSGMFSNLLLDARNVLLRRSYNGGRSTFQMWMKRGQSIEDFKFVHRVIGGEVGDPKAIPEDGEFEETTLTDGKESYRLTVWGEIASLSWQLLVNDQLGSFTELPMKMGSAMRRKQNRLAYAVVKDNAALSDGNALFDNTTHTNVTTGVLTTVADYVGAWNTMQKKLAEQRGLSAESAMLNLLAKWVIFPPALRGIIRQTLGSPSSDANNSGIVNIWQQGLMPIEEAELGASGTGGSDVKHYLASDANDVDTIEYAYLQGLEAPRIEQETAFDRLAVRQRIYHAFGVKALDYRGLQRHNGA